MWPGSTKPPEPTVGPEEDLEAFVTVELQRPKLKSHLLGDTGLSLPNGHRPRKLERWMLAASLPEEIQRLSHAHAALGDLRGVLRMRLSRAEPDDSVWVLARATDGLVGILVREDADDRVSQLDLHASFLVAQARRYCCTAALLLLDGRGRVDVFGAFRAFARAHGEAEPVANKLYQITDTRPQLFCAYLC